MSTDKANKVAIYCRVSSSDQRERETIRTQLEHGQRYCQERGLVIHDVYADDGVTGTIALQERPEGARLLEDGRRGLFNTVLYYNVKRLGREPRHILNAADELTSIGLELTSMTEPINLSEPLGRLMLTMLAGMAGFDRDSFVEVSIAGTNRLARDGVWLGGIVPYGYYVEGTKRHARLQVAEEVAAGCSLSEAAVVQLIFDLTTEEKLSCICIAERLNALNVPTVYMRDGRQVVRGKRKENTQGVWRQGRVRAILVNTTYKGVHTYGKNSKKKGRELIARAVPAIVGEAQWSRAQAVLRSNMIISRKNAKRSYLLRGLIKCEVCGLTYVGSSYPEHKTGEKVYYTCNGKHGQRGPFSLNGQRCPSKAITGAIEELVWQDIETFLRNPGQVLEQLEQQTGGQVERAERLARQIAALQNQAAAKASESEAVISLCRRGRITEADLDKQLEAVRHESKVLEEHLRELQQEAQSLEGTEERLESAASVLRELIVRVEQPLTWEVKREIVECLVDSIRVATIEEPGEKANTIVKRASVTVQYCFGEPARPSTTSVANHRGMGSRP